MPLSTPVPENHPLMVAWKKYQETEEYVNTLNWYGKSPQTPKATLWAAFMAGFNSHAELIVPGECPGDLCGSYEGGCGTCTRDISADERTDNYNLKSDRATK